MISGRDLVDTEPVDRRAQVRWRADHNIRSTSKDYSGNCRQALVTAFL